VVWVYPGPTDQIEARAREFVENRPFPANFRFVLDPGYAFTLRYGLRWDAPKETAYPSTFVIDRGGVVRFALISRTHDGRAPASDVLAALAALPK
jgi:peroxiredoxin